MEDAKQLGFIDAETFEFNFLIDFGKENAIMRQNSSIIDDHILLFLRPKFKDQEYRNKFRHRQFLLVNQSKHQTQKQLENKFEFESYEGSEFIDLPNEMIKVTNRLIVYRYVE